jgi:hypothetical protein
MLPSSIGAFTNITFFDVNSNYLRGTVPTTVSAWHRLAWFHVSQNQLSGVLPQLPFDRMPGKCALLDHTSGGTNAFQCPWPENATKFCVKFATDRNTNPITNSDCVSPTPLPPAPTPRSSSSGVSTGAFAGGLLAALVLGAYGGMRVQKKRAAAAAAGGTKPPQGTYTQPYVAMGGGGAGI